MEDNMSNCESVHNCKTTPWEKIAWGLIAAGAIVVALFLYQIVTNHLTWYDGKISIESSGQAGSFVGGTAGALWALAGVFFFMSALSLQRKELDLQRDEMQATRAILEQQSFENTFFKLLELKQKALIGRDGIEHTRHITKRIEDTLRSPHASDDITECTLYIVGDSVNNEYISICQCILSEIKQRGSQRYKDIFIGTLDLTQKMYLLCISLINIHVLESLEECDIKINIIEHGRDYKIIQSLYGKKEIFAILAHPL